ncbi:MAG: Crp/Fnr family transcriptional regulator [Clostridia bacterium]|nr:Crp/Fnr family transcriptional regulator [Clostridia bacterium]
MSRKGEIRDLLELCHPTIKSYLKQEVVFSLADFADQLGVVLSGEILVSKIFESGKLVRMTTKKTGDMIGEVACFSRTQTYPCQLTAEKNSQILIFSKADMKFLLQQNETVLQNFLSELSSQSYFLHKKIELLSYKGTDQKLAYFLLSSPQTNQGKPIPLPGSVVKLALDMNVSRTTLHREIRHLEEQNLIRYQDKTFQILNREGLQRVLSDE